MTAATAFLQATHVTKSFHAAPVLEDVNLRVNRGEMLFVAGASGSGKTTLLRLLAGTLRPDAGSVRVNGSEISALPATRRGTAFLGARDTLWPHLTARENTVFPLVNAGVPHEDAAEAVRPILGTLALERCADRKPEELSGSERQRVALARALAAKPELLLLDDPFNAADAATRRALWGVARKHCAENAAAAVCVAGDAAAGDVFAHADRVAALEFGRIGQVAPPLEIYRRPQTPQCAEFLGNANVVAGRVLFAGAGEFVAATPLGEVRGALADASANPGAGAAVDVLLRPESLHVDTFPPDENAFRGVVAGGRFCGAVGEVFFQTDAGVLLRVLELNPRALEPSAPVGAAMWAWVAPEDVTGVVRE